MLGLFQPRQKEHPVVDPALLATQYFDGNATVPACIRHINYLPEAVKLRYIRNLVPASLLTRFGIHPVTWRNSKKDVCVHVEAKAGAHQLRIRAFAEDSPDAQIVEPFFEIELQDNRWHGIELNLLLLRDVMTARFATDVNDAGRNTYFGTVHRNIAQEVEAMAAGLAPGQTHPGLGASTTVLQHIEGFLVMLAQCNYLLEPLTYASAILFERRGFRYVRGRERLLTIEREFEPGGALHAALDGSTPFRQPEQWRSIRGRAWAVHDGILDAIDLRWDDIRMMKTVGVHADVCTAPSLPY